MEIKPYDIVCNIDNQISDIVLDSPRQTSGLFKFIKNNNKTDVICVVFTEEIKDGRASRFDINNPLRLKGRVLGFGDFKIKVEEIKFDKCCNQESDYNVYVDYIYNVVIKRV